MDTAAARISSLAKAINELTYAKGTFLPTPADAQHLRVRCAEAVRSCSEEAFLADLTRKEFRGSRSDWLVVARFGGRAERAG
ncbi:MAG: hypothetical protein H0V44_14340 [Planctomycetes bacterium]|nr:hypothetical protein [Planctomycetota bacterium]